jgi:hypothetical protein
MKAWPGSRITHHASRIKTGTARASIASKRYELFKPGRCGEATETASRRNQFFEHADCNSGEY